MSSGRFRVSAIKVWHAKELFLEDFIDFIVVLVLRTLPDNKDSAMQTLTIWK
jgi:hypothetical protein